MDSLEAFARYLTRIRNMKGDQSLVVLTRTYPLALMVVDVRRRLESWLPTLRSARWMIYLDLEEDPFFEGMATRLGHLTGSISDAPIWIGPQDTPYLVMEAGMVDPKNAFEALKEVDELILGSSGTWTR